MGGSVSRLRQSALPSAKNLTPMSQIEIWPNKKWDIISLVWKKIWIIYAGEQQLC